MNQPNDLSTIIQDLRSYKFFDGFSDELLQQVGSFTKIKLFGVGEIILQQGQFNESLFFLADGQVDVRVDKEHITFLKSPGEILGEMSVISQLPVSATLVASTPVKVYYLDSSEFESISPKERLQFQFLIHKIYAYLLSERLRTTNFKARQAEISNRDLLKVQRELKEMNANLELLVTERTQEVRAKAEQLERSHLVLENQNAALTASYKKLSDQAQIRDTTFEKVKNLDSSYLVPLRKSLNALEQQIQVTSASQELRSAIAGVQGLSEQIKSLLDFFQAEKNMQDRRVLLVDPERKQQLIAKMALGGTGVSLDIASDNDSAREFFRDGKYDLVVCDLAMEDFMKTVHEAGKNIPIVAMIDSQLDAYLERLGRLNHVSYVVSRDINDRNFTTKTILTTINKIMNKDFFGLEKYLNWGVDVHEYKIKKSTDRAAHIGIMQESLKKIGVRNSILDQCSLVTEEMLMNAIYDAAVDSKGEPVYNHLPRTEAVELTEENAATFRFACDGTLIGLSVSDPFGTLQKKTIIDYLQSSYAGDSKGAVLGKAGAGRGLHQIIENSGLTIFNVQNRIKTEVICLINIDPTLARTTEQPGFHFFQF